MSQEPNKENNLDFNRHVMVTQEQTPHFQVADFAGHMFDTVEAFNHFAQPGTILYIYGDIESILDRLDRSNVNKIYIIKGISWPITNHQDIEYISCCQIPVNIHGVGVFFKTLFPDGDKDYYKSITEEHEFQSLTESNKPGVSHRKGIYITNVSKKSEYGNDLFFRLLRCSTNLSGPTDNFRDTDKEIINKVDKVQHLFFENSVTLNHVLAQTYHNSVDEKGKSRKAKISQHSDKTKDMPDQAIIAFCTFYKDYHIGKFNDINPDINRSRDDPYDYLYKNGTSILTKLRFKLKPEVADTKYDEKQFDITLYPNSVFLMSLKTNRLYTHEIVPSGLPANILPTRLGYVIRCSETRAIFDDKLQQTTMHKNGIGIEPLEEPTTEGIQEVKNLYYIENTTIQHVDYRDKFYFSLNKGDYMKPIL